MSVHEFSTTVQAVCTPSLSIEREGGVSTRVAHGGGVQGKRLHTACTPLAHRSCFFAYAGIKYLFYKENLFFRVYFFGFLAKMPKRKKSMFSTTVQAVCKVFRVFQVGENRIFRTEGMRDFPYFPHTVKTAKIRR